MTDQEFEKGKRKILALMSYECFPKNLMNDLESLYAEHYTEKGREAQKAEDTIAVKNIRETFVGDRKEIIADYKKSLKEKVEEIKEEGHEAGMSLIHREEVLSLIEETK